MILMKTRTIKPAAIGEVGRLFLACSFRWLQTLPLVHLLRTCTVLRVRTVRYRTPSYCIVRYSYFSSLVELCRHCMNLWPATIRQNVCCGAQNARRTRTAISSRNVLENAIILLTYGPLDIVHHQLCAQPIKAGHKKE